uniref:DENN/MADD domain containing 6B n=1 Tax=Xiphophorus couchianus TaxID=32473 RepID=A0A3B5M9V7_9TELE
MGLSLQRCIKTVRIPSKTDKPGGSPSPLPAPTLLPTIHELDLFKCFQSVLIHLQMLWELTLLGEPLVVMAPSPTVCSETILALVSSISPLKFCCDFRPYFTIHDSEFREYTTRTQAPPNVVLGVTNPFFIKTFQNWPHIVRLGEIKMAGDLPKQVKVKKLSKLKTLDTKPGIYTAYKTFLHKDKILIKRLLKSEVEIVDLILKLREKLIKARRQQLQVKDGVLDKLDAFINSIVGSLPEDLQPVLNAH